MPALEPSDSTESIDPLLVGDVGDVIMGDEAKKSNKKVREVTTNAGGAALTLLRFKLIVCAGSKDPNRLRHGRRARRR